MVRSWLWGGGSADLTKVSGRFNEAAVLACPAEQREAKLTLCEMGCAKLGFNSSFHMAVLTLHFLSPHLLTFDIILFNTMMLNG